MEFAEIAPVITLEVEGDRDPKEETEECNEHLQCFSAVE
jgi:hypothetical protein